ncbi:ATP-binding protein [Cryobacterium sp. MDB1-18-2]|uniref:ATP-binding protein n=2 Tax=Microbacteriaceae TaxID=85023 RepID=A0ABY2ILL9_9MICO|nr:ATP-binding protein [Cryobacterium sp. MDB2-A-1]TFC05884.1 ATP-binding protein [Cryobacterium sp. MDB2-33-2]TFC10579.1 ATP-binding protein [Cryobacterium sp. MDB2-A-2]TFC13807.1 ATP-binding protein [Cryobacterium sp. MDB2-10]TFC17332.1 ATP-binding protein [Cryobacterium glucosi]TFC28555.1 ATP-binding protein [Cryobacterium sp. MDB1-18-2]TFC40707.1 ATP-binding protein [Cryobacterium sp. MDB1-18-1]
MEPRPPMTAPSSSSEPWRRFMTASADPTELVIEGTTAMVRKIGPWLHGVLGELPDDEAGAIAARLELAVHEVAMNIIDHAGLPVAAEIRFSAGITDSVVEICVTDPGLPFDPAGVRIPVAGVPQERGYGLMLVRKLVNDLDYRRVDAGNRWTLRVNRTPPADSQKTGNEHQP